MNAHSLMVVPLLAGSGIRVKIIEGMALGKPVITTTVGIEGIECTYGKDVIVADIPSEFSKSIVYCMQNPEFAKTLAENGRSFAMENHDIRKITENLIVFYKERINGKKSA
jgi:glycosyltransferase involved in cell wall biosynthesis